MNTRSSRIFLVKWRIVIVILIVLLFLNIITQGRGMGLGDVKLALAQGAILGWPSSLVWIFLSFIIGGFVGLILVFFGKAKFGKKIAFGPFLIVSFFITLFWGDQLLAMFW